MGIRILGIDDSPFSKSDEEVLVVGVLMRGSTVEGVLSTRVMRDGDDSTGKVSAMISHSRFAGQVGAVMLNSIMLGGFNVVDIDSLSRGIGKPVIAVVRRKPKMEEVRKALSNVCCSEEKMVKIKRAGEVHKFGRIYAQIAGISAADAGRILARFSGIPEPIRLAHVIAGGIVRGESGGKA